MNEKQDPLKDNDSTFKTKEEIDSINSPYDHEKTSINEDFGYGAEDDDIKVVNELATLTDDTTLPCFTLRVVLVGIVSSNKTYFYYILITIHIGTCCS